VTKTRFFLLISPRSSWLPNFRQPLEAFLEGDLPPLARRLDAHLLEVGIDHDLDELAESDLRGPPELRPGLGRVGPELRDLRRTEEPRVDLDVFTPVEADVIEGLRDELVDRVGLPRPDDVVVGGLLLEHQPHGLDVLGGVAPVPLGVEVSDVELFRFIRQDQRDRLGDLAGDEVLAAPRGLVVEEDPVRGKEVVALAVVPDHPVGVDLGHGVGAPGLERRRLALGGWGVAEHLAARSLVEPGLVPAAADGLEDPGRPQARDVARVLGEVEANADVALGGEVVDLVGLDVVDDLRELA